MTELRELLPERYNELTMRLRRSGHDAADAPLGALRVGNQRPNRRGCPQRYKFSSPHSITSLTRAQNPQPTAH